MVNEKLKIIEIFEKRRRSYKQKFQTILCNKFLKHLAGHTTKTLFRIDESDFNFTDESTYLSPKIPVLSPTPLRITVPKDSDNQIKQLTEQVRKFSAALEVNNDEIKDHINNNDTTRTLESPNEQANTNVSQLQVKNVN